jgi:competence protein ComGC
MKTKRFKNMTVIISAVAILLAMGVTAFAANTSSDKAGNGKSAIWNILTDDQKAQLTNDAKTQLQQDLADGKITQEQYDTRLAAIENGEMPFGRGGKGGHGMTEEQKAAAEVMDGKWDSLTDAQKSEIYDLNDQKAGIESQIIDKYLEFGVIDSDTAASMKERIESQKSDIRKNGRMPMVGGRGMKGERPAAGSDIDN